MLTRLRVTRDIAAHLMSRARISHFSPVGSVEEPMDLPLLSESHGSLCPLGTLKVIKERPSASSNFYPLSTLAVIIISVNTKMTTTLWWGTAHSLATILHLVMGVVGIVTFHNTAIQALNDFMSGATVGASVPSASIGLMGEASLLQGVIAVVSQLSPQDCACPIHGCPRWEADHKA